MPHDPLATLRRRIEEVVGGRRNAMAFAASSGGVFTRKTLQSWIDGKTWPDAAEIYALAEATGMRPAFFLQDDGAQLLPQAMPGIVMVPRMAVHAAAGDGQLTGEETAIDTLPFPLEFAEKIAPRGAALNCLRATGDSMAPAIADGALVIIDLKQTQLAPWRPPTRKTARRPLPQDGIYVFEQAGFVRLKRLRDDGEGMIVILSDNVDVHPIEFYKRGRGLPLRIIGRVVWWDNRL